MFKAAVQLALCSAAVFCSAAVSPSADSVDNIKARAASIEPWIINIRRELHQIPELLYEEHDTSAALRKHLDALKIPYK